MKNLISSLRLQSKAKKLSNRKVFEANREYIAFNLSCRYRDGDDVREMVGVIWDAQDPLLPPLVMEMFHDDQMQDRYVPSTLDREDLQQLFGESDKVIAAGLAKASSVEAVPVFVVSNCKVSLYSVGLKPLQMSDEFIADC